MLSPHLDDAVLSCADHILRWKKQGHQVTVYTVFTRFPEHFISKSARNSLQAAGYKNGTIAERLRKQEDAKAMKQLGVKYKHMDFSDGWFRAVREKPVYPDKKLFEGRVSPLDKPIIYGLSRELKKIGSFSFVVTPLGIGSHVDHVVVRDVSEKIFNKSVVVHYIDFPYALKLRNWNKSATQSLLERKKSICWISSTKRKILQQYASQMSLLFSKKPNYPEMLLWQKCT